MARDAKLVASDEGRHWGTVGGGCTEADVIGQALDAARAGRPALVRHPLNADVAGDVGLSCGGTAEFFLEPIVSSADAAALYEAVGLAILGRTPAQVRTGIEWKTGPAKWVRVGNETVSIGTVPGPDHAASEPDEAREEHGVFRIPGELPRLGDYLLVVPGHICPTTIRYPGIHVIDSAGEVVDYYPHTARDRL